MPLLEVKNLHVEIDGKKILNGLDLVVNKGEVHAIMGPNGSGKSTLAHVLAGKAEYEVTEGDILLEGESVLEMEPDERAAKGVFLAFQYPVEIPGVASMTFLRTALNAQRKRRGETELTTPEFMKRVREQAGALSINMDMLRRGVNVGFSGGEKKRNEVLQMALLEPRLAVLDETDSGLDIDALKIVADGVNRLRSPERAFVVITHYQRLLNYIVPDIVHVLSQGPHREDRRQGARARARSQRLRAVPGSAGRGRIKNKKMAELTLMKNAAEQQLADEWQAAKARLPGAAPLRAAAFERFAAKGLPHRRVEEWKYTDLRALMRDAKPLASVPDAAAKARAKEMGALLADIDSRRIVFVDGAFVPELSDLASLDAGLTVRPMAQALAAGDALVTRHLGKVIKTDDPAVALNTAFMGDGIVIHVAAGAVIEHPVHLVFAASGDKPAALFTRSLVVIEKGARVMLVESHEGMAGRDYQANTALEMLVGDEAHVDHIKITREAEKALHLSTLMADVGAHARFNTFAYTTGGAVVRNQLFLRFGGEGRRGEHPRREPLEGPPARRHHHGGRPCGGRRPEPRSLQDRARRREPRRVPGQDHRAARRAADRRQNGLAWALAVGGRRGRPQARAGDLRRRRPVRPRRDRGRSRRGPAVLSQGARHSGGGGRGAADSSVCRRRDRGHRARRPARGADRGRGRLARDARVDDASGGEQRLL